LAVGDRRGLPEPPAARPVALEFPTGNYATVIRVSGSMRKLFATLSNVHLFIPTVDAIIVGQ
jgi:hypothetical protein